MSLQDAAYAYGHALSAYRSALECKVPNQMVEHLMVEVDICKTELLAEADKHFHSVYDGAPTY